jgi:hypothetical protein
MIVVADLRVRTIWNDMFEGYTLENDHLNVSNVVKILRPVTSWNDMKNPQGEVIGM